MASTLLATFLLVDMGEFLNCSLFAHKAPNNQLAGLIVLVVVILISNDSFFISCKSSICNGQAIVFWAGDYSGLSVPLPAVVQVSKKLFL